MHRAIYDKKGSVSTPHHVTHLPNAVRADFCSGTRHAVRAADFLNRSGRHGEQLAADAEENDLFRLCWTSLRWSSQAHQRTPAGAVRQIPRTRFSMAA